MQFTPKQVDMLQSIARSHPGLLELVDAWRQDELERMSACAESLFGTFKGRVQLLTELQQKLRPTP